jgi:hypothetical protein
MSWRDHFGSAGYFASYHSIQPPFKANTLEYPKEMNCRAIQALVSSFGQLQ